MPWSLWPLEVLLEPEWHLHPHGCLKMWLHYFIVRLQVSLSLKLWGFWCLCLVDCCAMLRFAGKGGKGKSCGWWFQTRMLIDYVCIMCILCVLPNLETSLHLKIAGLSRVCSAAASGRSIGHSVAAQTVDVHLVATTSLVVWGHATWFHRLHNTFNVYMG